ncbi:protein SPIRAL1-like 2 [Alnus glutinosa]|uniref:protein SPIRAL1-like 2 n=1 Tax=Alnus glutinosa TaxID=3517 RepID=UPI002D790D81|nr:protein SPIRAL1-like 2 [Alnus glutinosa]XP_062151017.1 protein SPIRAL1-like 2 [Alnus glutinosa]
MGRGVSAGGGQSSLGYLFGSGETTNKAQVAQKETTNNAQVAQNQGPAANNGPSQKPAAASPPIDKETPAGVPGHLTNNYFRAEGQNCGNFITDRPSTKVHAAPGGGSSLGYLFGGGGGK